MTLVFSQSMTLFHFESKESYHNQYMDKVTSDKRMYLCFAKNGSIVGQLLMKIFSCVHCACVMYICLTFSNFKLVL